MIIKMRYEDKFQELEVDIDAASQWVNISIETDETEEEFKKRIQKEVDEQYNKPEYNIYHRETRHIDPSPKRKKMNGKTGYICAEEGDKSFNIFDYLNAYDPTQEYLEQLEYEEVCTRIREVLKPELAALVITIALDGKEARELASGYVTKNNLSDKEYETMLTKEANKISKKYRRALKRLEKFFVKTSF